MRAGRLIVELARRWYEQDDATALPREIASRRAFENAMSLDIAMGGSTNTILHLLAAAQEAGVDFDMAAIDTLSRKIPQLCKVAPSTPLYHMEDVHRAGGVMAILGDSLGETCSTWTAQRCTVPASAALGHWDIMQPRRRCSYLYAAGPAGIPTSRLSVRISAGPASTLIAKAAA